MPVTLNQIAQACGVSRGTVDRALRNKGHVRPELVAQIKQTARELGYVTNRIDAACSMSSTVHIGVLLHSASTKFVEILAGCIQKTAAEMEELSVTVTMRLMHGLDARQQAALMDELIEKEGIDALAIMPLASSLIRDKINQLSEEKGIPVITFNTDIADCNRLAYVGTDNLAAGRTAAALMGLSIRGSGRVLAITGVQNGHYADSQRMIGFVDELQTQYPQIELIGTQQCFSDADMAERIVLYTLETGGAVDGIYVSSAGRSGVYRALQKANAVGKVHVIVHDLTPENMRMARDGLVDFIVGQDVQAQGTLPLRLLYDYLTKKKLPAHRLYQTDIEVKFRCNLGKIEEV